MKLWSDYNENDAFGCLFARLLIQEVQALGRLSGMKYSTLQQISR
jgi:hypothetical protein